MTPLLQQRPSSKRIGVLIEDLGDESVLYDSTSDRFVRLNSVSHLVWLRCDGESSVAEIAAAVGQELGIDDAAEVVWLALGLLASEALLEGDVELPEPVEGDEADGAMSRRTMLTLAGAGVALPLVASIIAPTPAAAQSAGGGGGGGPVLAPVDCVVSSWSAFSPCTKPCGGGTQTRTRTVVTPAANGGAPCPSLIDTVSCNTQPCPVDCVVSDWSAWGPCSAPCGGGTQTRSRTVLTFPANGGQPCPQMTQTQDCNTLPCP